MNKKRREITIQTEYITLGQLLKFASIIEQGGEAKGYLATHRVLVNGEEDSRRGRKLRDGDLILFDSGTEIVIKR